MPNKTKVQSQKRTFSYFRTALAYVEHAATADDSQEFTRLELGDAYKYCARLLETISKALVKDKGDKYLASCCCNFIAIIEHRRLMINTARLEALQKSANAALPTAAPPNARASTPRGGATSKKQESAKKSKSPAKRGRPGAKGKSSCANTHSVTAAKGAQCAKLLREAMNDFLEPLQRVQSFRASAQAYRSQALRSTKDRSKLPPMRDVEAYHPRDLIGFADRYTALMKSGS